MRLSTMATKFHKWLGLIVGIQILLWIAGGLVMSWFPIEEVRGQHNVREQEPHAISGTANLVALSDVLSAEQEKEVKDLTLRYMGERLVFAPRYNDGTAALFDAETGNKISPLSESLALKIATDDFSGDGVPKSIDLLDKKTTEYRGPVPVWRVYFDDKEDTRIYVSPTAGRVVARRNDTWRLFDFFWMLHIMDYDERDDFNHPLLIIASIVALIVSISGILLIFYRFKKRDFKWILPK
jgi:uncharacterized iron-regulated membrane protein